MALTTTNSVYTYVANGSQRVFTFPYKFTRRTDIRVTLIEDGVETKLVLGSDYNVDPDGGDSATVTLTTAPAAGVLVRINRVVGLTQPQTFPIQGPFDPKAVEAALDRAHMALQQLSDGVGVHVHGIEPGGNLHALATEQDHGFLSKHDYAWMKQHQGSGTAHEINQIRNLPDKLTEIELDILNRAPVVHGHPIISITGLRAELDAIIAALDGKEDAGSAVSWYRVIDRPTTIDGYGIVDAASIPFVVGELEDVAEELSAKADKAATYTKTEVDSALAAKANTADVYTKVEVDNALAGKENVGSDINWSRVVNRPTTLSGYGITDAYTKTEVNTALAGKENVGSDINWSRVIQRPTDLSGYGITDAYTKTEVNTALAQKADTSDVYTKIEVDSALSAKANVSSVYTKTETNNLLSNKADKATSLAGYGILDAYTKSEANSLLGSKADKANTLAGYGINDAYTKAEVDNLLSGLTFPKIHVARFVSQDGQMYFLESGDADFFIPEAEAQNDIILVMFEDQTNPVMFTFAFGPPSGPGTVIGHVGNTGSNKVEIVFTTTEPNIYPTHFDIWAFVQQ